MIVYKLIGFLTLLLLMFSCAQISAPTGGNIDETAPVLDSNKTFPANYSTNFNGTALSLTFDEYFVLTNPNENVFISPILENDPKFITKGKQLTIELNNKLKENTTYTINFGDALKDFNAGNILKNFNYVFSTGSYIDSLQIKGTVTDAYTSKPSEEVLVMLYDEYNDSVVTKNKPYYFAKTDKTGTFNIKYIKQGKYKVFALKDENRNYKFDLPNEQVAFIDSIILIDTNSSKKPLNLKLFEKEYKKQQITSKIHSFPGKLSLILNVGSKKISIKNKKGELLEFDQIEQSENLDSITLWNIDNDFNKKNIIVKADTFIDTILIYPYKKPKKDTLLSLVKWTKKIDKENDLILTFDRPIKTFDTSLFNIYKDSIKLNLLSSYIDSNDKKKVVIKFHKKQEQNYKFKLLPKGVKDIYGYELNDTSESFFSIREDDFYGSFTFNLKSIDTNYLYIIKLYNSDKLIDEQLYKNTKIKYQKLAPAKYSIKIVIDKNKNKKWDTGNYYNKQQPEEIFKFTKIIEVRSNWDIEEELDFKNN